MDHSSGKCQYCDKNFANCKLKNRHIKRVHRIVMENSRKSRILCPLCQEESDVKTYENLRKHLEENHGISIEKLTLQFSSSQEYEMWKNAEKIDTNYAMHRASQLKDHKEVHYECNKSDTRGYQPKYCKKAEKSGGTIKMHGVCPSKLIVKFYNGSKLIVNFWKTHAGHDEKELRNKHLSTTEKNMVVEKLKSGVPIDRILEDARKLEMPKLERINLLSRDDVTYLSKKYNIDKKRDNNEMVAAAEALVQYSQIKTHHQEEIEQFVEEKMTEHIADQVDESNRRTIQEEHLINWIHGLDDEAFDRFRKNIQEAMTEEDQRRNKATTTKRKMVKQEYIPSKKRKE